MARGTSTTSYSRPDVASAGWFADVSDEADRTEGFPWQPFLQLDGLCLPLPMWFATEEECVVFIRTEIIGRGEWPKV